MGVLPETVERYVVERFLEPRHAFVLFGAEARVERIGGDAAWFGIGGLAPGAGVEALPDALQEVLGADGPDREVLPRVVLVEGRSSDVHVVRSEDGAFLLLRDATPEARRELRYQQRGNELALLLRVLGVGVFEERDGHLEPLGLEAPWQHALCPRDAGRVPVECFPFLENFLVDAQRTWGGEAPPVAWSGIWIEADARGREWSLEASAARLEDGRRLLVVQSVERRYREEREILQQARVRSLEHDRLRAEIDRKEALLHCIIHDLKGPLSGMVGSMSLVKAKELAPDRVRELLELGLEQARYQEAMIKSLLEAFAAEVESLEYFESEAALAPDLVACVRGVVAGYRPAFELNGVGLELDAPEGPLKVVGEPLRLERVLINLLENALRCSPARSTVRVLVAPAESDVRVTVEDEGPGVPPEIRGDLFRKFTRGGTWGGVAGLGLYFCRSTVETWGGSIGHEPAGERGARFSFTLPRAI